MQSPIITHSSQFPNTYAIIRELHTYGDQMRVGQVSDGSGQHMGFGKNLLQKAEEIVKSTYPDIQKIYIISGI
jgi:elongator complex protein 3